MNNTQRKYMVGRINEILESKVRSAQTACAAEIDKLTDKWQGKEIIKGILDGTFKPKKDVNDLKIRYGAHITYLFDIPDKNGDKIKELGEKREKVVEALRLQATSLKDKVTLGDDSEECIRLLEEFAAK